MTCLLQTCHNKTTTTERGTKLANMPVLRMDVVLATLRSFIYPPANAKKTSPPPRTTHGNTIAVSKHLAYLDVPIRVVRLHPVGVRLRRVLQGPQRDGAIPVRFYPHALSERLVAQARLIDTCCKDPLPLSPHRRVKRSHGVE